MIAGGRQAPLSREVLVEPAGDLAHQRLGCGEGRVPPEAVGLTGAPDADDLDARLRDPPGELLSLVSEGVGLRRGDEGRRQGVQAVGEQRGEVGVVVVGLGPGVLLPVPGRLGRVEARLLPERHDGNAVRGSRKG